MTSILLDEQAEIPLGIRSLRDFRTWTQSQGFPRRGRIDFVAGRIEVDKSPEDLHRHGKLKTEILVARGNLVKQQDLGEVFGCAFRLDRSRNRHDRLTYDLRRMD